MGDGRLTASTVVSCGLDLSHVCKAEQPLQAREVDRTLGGAGRLLLYIVKHKLKVEMQKGYAASF